MSRPLKEAREISVVEMAVNATRRSFEIPSLRSWNEYVAELDHQLQASSLAYNPGPLLESDYNRGILHVRFSALLSKKTTSFCLEIVSRPKR